MYLSLKSRLFDVPIWVNTEKDGHDPFADFRSSKDITYDMLYASVKGRVVSDDLRRLWFVFFLVCSACMWFLAVRLIPITVENSDEKSSWRLRLFKVNNTISLSFRSPTVKTFLDEVQNSSSKSYLFTTVLQGNNTDVNNNLPKHSTKNVINRAITSRANTTLIILRGANTTKITNAVQMDTTSNSYSDVMPTQKPPSDIVPLKSANYSVCAILMGGLGNQMFQFATSYGLAAQKRMSVAIDKTAYLTKVFKLDIDQTENYTNICKTFVGRGEKLNCGYDERMTAFTSKNNYRVGAYLQSWKYFYNASASLRKQFVFHDKITETKNKVIDSVLKKYSFASRFNVTLVGVHIRRGDLVNHKFGYRVASESYLQKSVDYFQAKRLKNIIYIICSNDVKWSKAYMPKGIRSEYVEGNSPEIDMAILGSCDHMISTVGTFSWWSAWLTGGEVTFYKWPAKEGSALRKQFSKDYVDYFHPGWIGFS
ncbi:galactoside alpha-(1,2)-fucosyltransferase 2-like [Ylistrum balloti]|uniref:galactoside alpha-(1,2)-fucosyltransferase 2-like n=1 Tax=Ylistrum balloti TaxID=509963 RepID=UPI002905D952|nr:galactoside alpha-(1,2)-fucosyltransferase 2-like [Ylistrum balloti]